MRLRFYKLSGAGNDFVLLDESAARPALGPALARRLCDRRRSIGADGFLAVKRRPLSVHYFNADGSRAFCANGTRCAAWWMHKHGWTGAEMRLQTAAGPLGARVVGPERIRLEMPTPGRLRWNLRLKTGGKAWRVHALEVGVPHAVVEVEELDVFPVIEIGRQLRRHPAFGKAGTNVNFVERRGRRFRIRTYERGVEDETLACGTGAVACAFWAYSLLGARNPIHLETRGGDTLTARFDAPKGILLSARLEGPARITFEGAIDL